MKLDIELNRESGVPLTEQIVNGVTRWIGSRTAHAGTKLPSIRQFAADHAISRFPVIEAYDRLVSLGYLDSRHGSGFYVAQRARAGAGTLQNDRAAVRHDQAIPYEERTCLPKGDLRIVLADEARALGDQKDLSRWAVIDVFRHLCGELAGQAGAQPGGQCGGDHRSRLQHVFARRRLNAIWAGGEPVNSAIEEGELVIL